MLTNSTKLSVEIYQKNYRHFPIDPGQPALFLIDEIFYRYGFFMNHENLQDNGKTLSRGVEVMLQKSWRRIFMDWPAHPIFAVATAAAMAFGGIAYLTTAGFSASKADTNRTVNGR